MPTPEEQARRIFGQRAAWYTTSTVHADPEVLGRVVELAAPQPHWAALDVATGTGHTAFALAPHVASVVGVDLTPELLAEAEQLKARRGVANVTFRCGDAHQLPFPDRAFDLVTCRRSAHHFSDLSHAIREMRRVLRPGGRLVIDDRSVPEDDIADRVMNEIERYHDASHVCEYRPSAWRRMLEEAGLVMEVVKPYVRRRPISVLTKQVAPENVAKIYAILEGLDAQRRAQFGVDTSNGELHSNHWYVMLAARRV